MVEAISATQASSQWTVIFSSPAVANKFIERGSLPYVRGVLRVIPCDKSITTISVFRLPFEFKEEVVVEVLSLYRKVFNVFLETRAVPGPSHLKTGVRRLILNE